MFSGQPEPSGATDKRVNAVELLDVLYSQKSRPSLRWLRKMTAAGIIPVERHGRMLFYVPSQVVAALNRYGRFHEQERKKRRAAKIEANQTDAQSKEVDDQTSRAEV
ncbi:MAG: hypothetical protein KIS67_25115 [Verrucomicrobiae bacterium]|nr:hypothetical protein [Verrucomicrobiae bacterium]